jgi:hypothetical protein
MKYYMTCKFDVFILNRLKDFNYNNNDRMRVNFYQ